MIELVPSFADAGISLPNRCADSRRRRIPGGNIMRARNTNKVQNSETQMAETQTAMTRLVMVPAGKVRNSSRAKGVGVANVGLGLVALKTDGRNARAARG